jgi:Putative pectate lyase-like adhesive domain
VGKRLVGAVVAMGALAGASLVVLGAGPAAATTVTDEATFRAAWTNAAETQIDLAADITLANCGAGLPGRSSSTSLNVNGNGHTITQTCANLGVLGKAGAGLVTLNNVTITGGDSGSFGGGIFGSGPLTLDHSTFTGNTAVASGGGIALVGTLTLTDSTVSNNTAGAAGGGVLVNGPVIVTGSTVSGNSSTTGGGGIRANPGPITITNSTVTGNTDPGGGGGVLADNAAITITYATIVGNSSTFGANVAASTSLVSFGSVVALPAGGATNCGFLGGSQSTTSNGFNFSDDASCGFTAATDKQSAGDPGLGALADNGGSTLTRLPQTGSPLIDAIPNASCQDDGASGITTDQRGVSRPQGAGCDIGAVEVAGPTPPPPLPTGPGAAVPVQAVVRFTG